MRGTLTVIDTFIGVDVGSFDDAVSKVKQMDNFENCVIIEESIRSFIFTTSQKLKDSPYTVISSMQNKQLAII
jgi:hypothetical protein